MSASTHPSHVSHPSRPFAYAGGYAPLCEGIHALTRDADGRVRARLAADVAGSPTWLQLSGDGRRLHALIEEGNAIASFDVDAGTGALTLLSRHETGALPVHLALDESAGEAWIAHYGDGSLRRTPVDGQGALGAPDLVIAAQGGGAAPAHAHMVRRHPRWPFMLATDLGQERLRVFRTDVGVEGLALTPTLSRKRARGQEEAIVELAGFALPAGSGPRHFVFHPQQPEHMYLLNEQANALDWLGLDASGGITHRLRVSSLPAGFEGLSYASDLLVAPDGRRLLALNRLHDAIAVFGLDAEGRPSWRGEVWAQGSYPRSATLAPDGRSLWVSLQRSHQIAVFALDGVALPRFDGEFIGMPGAACVVFR